MRLIRAFETNCTLSFPEDVSLYDSPADVAFVLSHAEVPLHVVPGVSQLSSGKVADLTNEGFRSCKIEDAEFIHQVWKTRSSVLRHQRSSQPQNAFKSIKTDALSLVPIKTTISSPSARHLFFHPLYLSLSLSFILLPTLPSPVDA